MRKKLFVMILCSILIFVVGASALFSFQKEKKESLPTITLAEVAHTLFYAPMYVAIENGFFEKHGINIDLILASGADKVTAAVLSGDADIGFCGSEATIYVYLGGEKDYLQTFSQLTQKDGTFLVSRKKYDSFSLEDLRGKTIIGGRSAGMPEMTLEYALKQNGINPKEDVTIDTSIAFAAMAGAFMGGEGDFVTLFEPTASMIEKEGYGSVVASVGEIAGVVPYTSYSARKSYIQNHSDLIYEFDSAIQEGLDYVHQHSDEEVALLVQKQFPDSSLEEIIDAIHRYRMNDTWPKTTSFSKQSFDHLQEIMIDYGELETKVPYEELFYSIS